MEAVKVGVCIRPFLEDELSRGDRPILFCEGHQVKLQFGDGREKTFNWDFEPLVCTQEHQGQPLSREIVEESKSLRTVQDSVVNHVFQGYNCTVFNYGGSKSGKSRLLFGEGGKPGHVQRVCQELFERALGYEESTSFRAEVSFFEVHGDTITDLIARRSAVKTPTGTLKPKLKVRESEDHGVHVDKLTKHIVTDFEETKNLLEKGLKSRRRLAALDPGSQGLTHAIFTVTFSQARLQDDLPLELISKMTFIDLASRDPTMNGFADPSDGSEDSLTNGVLHHQQPLETLTEVIASLAARNYSGKNSSMSQWGNPVVPYKDSTLTWLMKDALGGNCETIMLCCVSPSEKHMQDTVNTLKQGSIARNILNKPIINEEANVKLIKELKAEIDTLKAQQNAKNQGNSVTTATKKLHRDEELMKRLTGIWEEKWSKTQKMIQEKEMDVVDLGQGVKLESKEPHFVSLGGGRLSVGVSIIPIKKGMTTVGVANGHVKPDLEIRGKGVVVDHCTIEYNGEAVVLHPNNELVAVDGLPITTSTRLHQGCMVCVGNNNYFRFNNPKEAARIKEANQQNRFSIAPDVFYPDIQLAIEQRKQEMLERDRLKAENERLLALERQYLESLERLGFEKEQLVQEKRKLQALQQQNQTVANQFDRKISIQIEELQLQREEIRRYELEKVRLREKEKEIELTGKKLEENRMRQEEMRRAEYDRLLHEQAKLELNEFEELERRMMNEDGELTPTAARKLDIPDGAESTDYLRWKYENERQELAAVELETLAEDIVLSEMYNQQKEEITLEKMRLEEMTSLHRKLEAELSLQIDRLQKERERELEKINTERERLKVLQEHQEEALEQIDQERRRLESEKESERQRITEEQEKQREADNEQILALQRAAEESQRDRELIDAEKQRLINLEEEHRKAMLELEQNMVSQQERLERERQLEMEYIETEQLMLEELEQKQFESARQMEYETQLLREHLQVEKGQQMVKMADTKRKVDELAEKHERALLQAEEERRRLQEEREKGQEELRMEREKLSKLEETYKEWMQQVEDEKKVLREEFEKEKREEIERVRDEVYRTNSLPSSFRTNRMNTSVDPSLLQRSKTPEDKVKQIEEERQRLTELKKQAAEKAELEWMEKKKELERKEIQERELEEKRKKLDQMKRDQEIAAERERRVIEEEAEKIRQHEEQLKRKERELEDLKKERARRQQLETMLEDERRNECELERSLSEEKKRLETLERSLSEERSKRQEIEKILEQKQKDEEAEKTKLVEKRRLDSRSSLGTLRRRIPSYTPSVRSCPGSVITDEINLLHHLVAAGHIIENCPSLKVNRYSCRGYLSKMGKSRFHTSWKKKWFVFDRKLRALCYYQDERKTKPAGVLYFQAIREVYVDPSIKRSPNPKTTFCVKTPQKTYVLSASSPIAMSVWIDVICTGREGALC